MVMTRNKNWRWEELEKDSIELGNLARHFELYNRTEGKNPKTIDWYNLSLKQFQGFLVQSERSIQLRELDEAGVREFILLNRQGKLKAISIQTYVRGLRAFFNWLYKEGYTTENRLVKLKPPRAPIRVVEVLTQEEITRVLSCIDQNTAGGAQNYAILMLLLDSGLRCSKLMNAELKNVNMEGGYIAESSPPLPAPLSAAALQPGNNQYGSNPFPSPRRPSHSTPKLSGSLPTIFLTIHRQRTPPCVAMCRTNLIPSRWRAVTECPLPDSPEQGPRGIQ